MQRSCYPAPEGPHPPDAKHHGWHVETQQGPHPKSPSASQTYHLAVALSAWGIVSFRSQRCFCSGHCAPVRLCMEVAVIWECLSIRSLLCCKRAPERAESGNEELRQPCGGQIQCLGQPGHLVRVCLRECPRLLSKAARTVRHRARDGSFPK